MKNNHGKRLDSAFAIPNISNPKFFPELDNSSSKLQLSSFYPELIIEDHRGNYILDGMNILHYRAVGRSENPGVPVLHGGHNLSLLVEIGLTNLPKSGVAMAPPGTTPLH